MDWKRIERDWKQFKGTIQEQWGKLTDDQLDVIAGKREQLSAKIQEVYGITRDETQKQLFHWQKSLQSLTEKDAVIVPAAALKSGRKEKS